MINLHIVMEVIQKRMPAPTIVRIPGTHPNTLKAFLLVLEIEIESRASLRKRPCLSHNGKTDLVSGEQPGGLLPRHGSELDVMFAIYER
jgi:hypothetical protein